MRKRGVSRLWAKLLQWGVVRAHMPYWRVVVEARPDRRARKWRGEIISAVAPVYVWARTIEEAEGLASLAVEQLGLIPATADAVKVAPSAYPRREPAAVACGALGFVIDEERLAATASTDAPRARS